MRHATESWMWRERQPHVRWSMRRWLGVYRGLDVALAVWLRSRRSPMRLRSLADVRRSMRPRNRVYGGVVGRVWVRWHVLHLRGADVRRDMCQWRNLWAGVRIGQLHVCCSGQYMRHLGGTCMRRDVPAARLLSCRPGLR